MGTEENEAIEGKICGLLALGNGVLAVRVITAALPSISEEQICCALVRLCEKEAVAIDGAGVHLCGAIDNVAEEGLGAGSPTIEQLEESPAIAEGDASDLGSSLIPPIGEKEELLGSTNEPDYSDTYLPEDEIDAMLERMGYVKSGTSRTPAARDEGRNDGSHTKTKVLEESVAADPVVADSSVKCLNLKTRAANYCTRDGVRRIEDLVRVLPMLGEVRGLGFGSIEEIRTKLARAARPLSRPAGEEQMGALCSLSGSREFVFDMFGVLCVADGRSVGGDALADGETADRDMGRPVFGWKLIEPQRFCSSYSEQANDLVGRLQDCLAFRGLPLNVEALRVTMLPRMEQLMAEHGGDIEGALGEFAQLVTELEADEHALIACTCELRRRARKLIKGASKGKGKGGISVVVPQGACWTGAAHRVEADNPTLSFDSEARILTVRLPTLKSWLGTLKPGHAQALSLRLQGETLEQAGNILGLTRERIRQITVKVLDKRPALEEDRYRSLFDSYQMTREQFCAITGESDEVYGYLALTKPKGVDRRPLEEALDNEALDETVRAAIREVAGEGFAYIDGVRVALQRKPVIEALLKSRVSEECVSLDEFLALYRTFVEEHGMDDMEVFEGTGPRAMAANLDRWEFVMQSGAPKEADGVRRDIRYYDWDARDFTPLREAIRVFAVEHRGVECSTALLMRDEAVDAAAAALDVRNEYELHCVLRRIMGDVDFMTLKKRPIVQFGRADRNRQVLELIEEMGPADAYELAAAYEERYGVAEATFRGSFLKDFASYETGGRYAVVEAELTASQRELVNNVLRGRPYVAFGEVRERFESAFPDALPLALGARNLEPLGYATAGGLLVREDVDLPSVFGDIMDSRDTFGVDDADLGRDVFRNEIFRSELNKRIRAFQIVEYEPDRFVLTSTLARMGASVTTEDLRDFVDAAIEFMEPGRPYSVKALRTAGFTHPVFGLSDVVALAGDFFFGSLIATGYVGDRVKLTSCNGVSFFSRKSGQLSAPDIVAWEVGRMDKPTEDSLIKRLNDEHGVEIAKPLLRMLLKRAGVQLGESASVAAAAGAAASPGGTESGGLMAIDFFTSGN